MRKLLPILFIFCLTANIVSAAPNYDPDFKGVTYDTSYNIALRNRLEKQYHDKCTVKYSETYSADVCDMNAYTREVEIPYNHQKINNNPAYY